MIRITDLAVFVTYGNRRYLVIDRDDVPPNRIKCLLPPMRAVSPRHRRPAPSLKAASLIARQERAQAKAIQAQIDAITRVILGRSAAPIPF